MKRWECTVCGYIHEGEQPPEKCPICGADRSKFVELPPAPASVSEAEETSKNSVERTTAPKSKWQRLYRWLLRQMTRQHAHPISVHIPNGVLPAAVIFLILSLFLESGVLAEASFYNMVLVALTMPFVLFSGYNDWRRLFEGKMSSLFATKMICGGLLALLAPLVVIWKIFNPEILNPAAGARALYILLHLVMLAAAVLAGLLGGKLVIFRGFEKE